MPTVKPHIERSSPGAITEQDNPPRPAEQRLLQISDEGGWIKIVLADRHNGKNGSLSQTTVGGNADATVDVAAPSPAPDRQEGVPFARKPVGR
jgi:hypothetical protein